MNRRLARGKLTRPFIIMILGLITAAPASGTRRLLQDGQPPSPAPQGESSIRDLEIGKPVVRELKADERHAYDITLTTGQLLRAVVTQRGIDVVVALFAPDGAGVVEVDSPNGAQGPELLSVVAESTGTYRLEVRSLEKRSLAGNYEIKLEEVRTATPQELSGAAAERIFRQARSLSAQGTAESLKKSVEKYDEALPLYRAAGDVEGEAVTRNNLGAAYYNLGEKEKALENYAEALRLFRQIKNPRGEATALNNLGRVYYNLGDNQKALDKYTQALSLYRSAGDRGGEATALTNVARIYDSRGEQQNALEHFNQALQLFRDIGDRRGEATALNSVGAIYDDLGERQKALEHYAKALGLFRAVEDRTGEAVTLTYIGRSYDDVGDKDKALEYYSQSLPLYRSSGDRGGEATVLNNVGAIYNDRGEKRKALAQFLRALALFQAVWDRRSEATMLNNIGAVYADLGEKQKALKYYLQALELRRAAENRSGEATTLNNIGKVYDDLGDYRTAQEHYARALSLYRSAGDRDGEALALGNLGKVHDSLGQQQEALDTFTQALQLYRTVGDRDGEATTLHNIAAVFISQGKRGEALDTYAQALGLRRALGDRRGEAMTLNNIGGVYDEQGEKRKALGYYLRSLALRRAVEDSGGEAITLNNIAAIHDELGRKRVALGWYNRALSTLEGMRAAATLEEVKIGLSGEASSTYARTSLLLMSMGQHGRAFEVTERARARALLDQLGNVHPNARNLAETRLLREEREVSSRLDSLEGSLSRAQSQPLPSRNQREIDLLKAEVESGRRRLREVLTRLKLSSPEYVTLHSVSTLPLASIQQLLDKETTLLSYFVTTNKTLAFIITRDSFRAVELPVKESDLEAAVSASRDFTDLREVKSESLRQLHQWLIAPLARYMKTPAVGIIPHGVLHYLSFAALNDGEQYFGEQYRIFHLPSASVLSFVKKKSRPVGSRVLAVAQSRAEGLPVLRHVDEEVKAVATIYNGEAFTTGTLTKAKLMRLAGDYGIIHIAAHAELDTTDPLFSRIRLEGGDESDGSLDVRDVYDMSLERASLVVLSACRTELGSHSRGDDIVGLSRAFIYAGAPTVISTLWEVDDESTGYLMQSFYTHLKGGMGKAAALAAAQAETRGKYPHPYHWAGFVLTGAP